MTKTKPGIDHEATFVLAKETIEAYRDMGTNPVELIGTYAHNYILATAYWDLTARVELLDALIGDTQDFLKHLLAGKSQYYYGDRLMANGESHAKELDQHIKAALKEAP